MFVANQAKCETQRRISTTVVVRALNPEQTRVNPDQADAGRRRCAALTILRGGIADLLHRPAKTLPGLDALRSLAIILVLSDHYYANYSLITQSELGVGRFPLFYFGWTGVDLFFVLSGYLIGSAIWRELQSSSTLDVSRFLLRRGLRIWPYYFFFIAWSVAYVGSSSMGEFLPDILFFSNYKAGRVSGGWSLSTEEQFYLVAPLMLLITTRVMPLSKQWVILVITLVALPIARAITLARVGPHAHGGMDMFIIYTPFHTHADGLVVGLLLAWIIITQVDPVGAPSWIDSRWAPLSCVIAGVVLRQISPDLFAFTALALIFGGCVLFALRDRSPFSRVAGLYIFYAISRLSYAMYLNHFVVLRLVMPEILAVLGDAGRGIFGFFLGYVASIATSLAIACATFLCIESPFLQLREAWLKSRPASRNNNAGVS